MKYLKDMILMNYNPNEYEDILEEQTNKETSKNDGVSNSNTEIDSNKVNKKVFEPNRHEMEIINNLSWKLQIVLTKCDLVERSMLARRIQQIRTEVIQHFPYLGKGGSTSLPLMMISGLHGNGIIELQKELAALIPPRVNTTDTSSPIIKEKATPESIVDNVVNAFSKIAGVKKETSQATPKRSSNIKFIITQGSDNKRTKSIKNEKIENNNKEFKQKEKKEN